MQLKTSLSNRSSLFFPILVLMGISFLAYANSFKNPFVLWDDNWLIYQNRWVTSNSFYGMYCIFSPWIDRSELGAEYLPIPQFSYFLEHLFWDLNPIGYHFTQTLLYMLCNLLLFYLIRTQHSLHTAFWVTALFAVHPIHTESVTWLSSRKDLWALFFFLGTFLAHQSRQPKLALACLVGTLFSKGTAVILIGCLLLWDRLHQRDLWSSRYFYAIGIFLTTSIVGFHIWIAGQHGNLHPEVVSFEKTLVEFGGASFLYLRLLFFPVPLLAHYELAPILPWIGWSLVFFLIGGSLFYSLKRFFSNTLTPISFFWLWFWGTLLPVSNLLFYRTSAFVAERYLLFPSLAFCYVLVLWISAKRHYCLGTIVILFLILTWNRNQDWSSTERLWQKNLAISPKNATVLGNLGMYYQEQAQKETQLSKQYFYLKQAEHYYEQCLKLQPLHIRARHNLGLLQLEYANRVENRAEKQFHLQEAQKYFQQALQINPKMVQALSSLGGIAFQKGELAQAKQYYWEALAQEPSHLVSQVGLGNIFLSEKKYLEAENYYQKAFLHRPQERVLSAYCLGLLYAEWSFNDPKKIKMAESFLESILEEHPKAKRELFILYCRLWNQFQERNPSAKENVPAFVHKFLALLQQYFSDSPERYALEKWLHRTD